MKLSLEQGDIEKVDEKWSKMFGIRQVLNNLGCPQRST
jgi:hypothetical protein